MHISKLDMKSLAVFATVMRAPSLSRAAQQLGMTQPAISQTIARLRIEFGDPLLVRTTRGTRPTERALALLEPVDDILSILRERLESRAQFHPGAAQRTFTFVSTDFGATVFLTRLNPALQALSPLSRVRAMPLNTATMKAQLESGEIDLAAGAFSELVAGFHQRAMFVDDWICLAGAHYPHPKGRLTKKAFVQAQHAILTPPPPGYEPVLQLVRREVPASQIRLEVPSFLSLLFLLRESNLLCIVPRRVGANIAALTGLASHAVPYVLPGLDVRQYWHDRVHHDPAHRWFRGLLSDLFEAERAA